MTALKPVYFLLVDDLEKNLLSLEALLRRDGLVILKARSGREALELLLKHEIALALLDVQMPEMDGFELAELMRGTDRTRCIPIIFITAGNEDRQRRFRGYEAGAVDFLHKPIEADILRSKAGVFFDLYRQQQEIALQRDMLKASVEENARLLEESRAYAAALKEEDRRKDEFLATLAHELRNPLAPIRNGLQILRMAPDSDASEKARAMMDRQITHMVRLIDDLLDVSRISQGKIDLRKGHILLRTVIDEAIEASRPLIEGGKHSLTLNIPQKDLWLDGDLTRLAQIVGNLLNNAAKYTPEGGKIELTVEDHKKTALIIISDNGIGIPSEMIPKVFDLFTQVDHTVERSQGGLGIGLALVKRLIEMHGGKIEASSLGLGKGSRFKLHIPLLLSPPMQSSSDSEKTTPISASGKPLSVLVVDDNVPSAKTIGWILEMLGHSPFLVHDGLEALEAAKKIKPDVVLLDIGLPGMNGYDVCRTLRQDPLFKDTILMAQTGWGQDKDRQQAKEAGFDHYLVKPVQFEEFSALLGQIKKTTA